MRSEGCFAQGFAALGTDVADEVFKLAGRHAAGAGAGGGDRWDEPR
jgi:hypothetical protein